MATFTGTNSSDTITRAGISAGVTADLLGSKPSAAADTINGRAGDDTLDGAGGGDAINGGPGNDTISDSGGYYSDDYKWNTEANAGNRIHGDAGNDEIRIEIYDSGGANPVDNVAFGDDGDDSLMLRITDGADWYDTPWTGAMPTGTVSLYGGAGADLLQVDEIYIRCPDVTTALYGDAGDDDLRATSWIWEADGSHSGGDNTDRLYGGTGDDSYLVLENKDLVIEKAGEGYDTVTADKTDYILPANVEKLVMANSAYYAEDTFSGTGNELDNVIIGWASGWADGDAERLDGGAGNDTIYGSKVDGYWTTLDGFDRDIIHGGAGNDTIHGAYGEIDGDDHSVFLDDDVLYGDAGNDEIFGLYGNDLIYGGTGDDKLWGQSENDTIYGGNGNDKLGGGSGEDHLYGDAGNDVISGTGGRDWLTGGAGNDRFDYDNVSESAPGAANRDIIVDFFGAGAKGGDIIDLSSIDANSGAGGNQAFIFGGTGAGHVRAVASGADSLIQADIGGEAGPELEILVSGVAASQWTAGDFIL